MKISYVTRLYLDGSELAERLLAAAKRNNITYVVIHATEVALETPYGILRGLNIERYLDLS